MEIVKTLNVGQQSLMGYLPAIVIQEVIENRIDFDNKGAWSKALPQYYNINTVAMFAGYFYIM